MSSKRGELIIPPQALHEEQAPSLQSSWARAPARRADSLRSQLGSPVCKVYGNRRALTCMLLNPSHSPSSSSFHNSAAGDRSPPPSSPNELAEEEEESWKPVLPDEATVEEALELDPDPEGLDDEDLQDALRGEADEEGEREGRRRRRRSVAVRRVERRQVQEVYTWEACARVVSRERGDFFEFVVSCRLSSFQLSHRSSPSNPHTALQHLLRPRFGRRSHLPASRSRSKAIRDVSRKDRHVGFIGFVGGSCSVGEEA